MIIIPATKTKTGFGRSHVAVISFVIFFYCSLEKTIFVLHNDNDSPAEGIIGEILVVAILVERL